MKEAGYAGLLPFHGYLAPISTDLPEAEALAVATHAMKDYGFTDDTLAFFVPSMSLQSVNGQRAWVAEYTIDMYSEWRFHLMAAFGDGKIGSYRVELDADTGKARALTWDLQEYQEDRSYTQSTWGQARVYDVALLPWLRELAEARRPFTEKDEASETLLPLAGRAAHDQLFRDAGFSPEQFSAGLPTEGDIPQEEAWKMAKEALESEFGVTGQELESGHCSAYFTIADPDHPQWFFWIFPAGDRQGQEFSVTLDAKSGTIIDITHSAGGFG